MSSSNNIINNRRRSTDDDRHHEGSSSPAASEIVVEDGPQMRSVAMMSAAPSMQPAASTISSFPPPLMARPSPFGGSSPPPALRFGSGSQLFKEQPTVQHPEQQAGSKSSWEIRFPLEPVPDFYHLERTHVVVENVDVAVLARRVSDCLRKESIAATYGDEEASVEAETRDGVHFFVRMWAAGGDAGKIIVEVQRMSGCCYLYCQAAKSVLRAAKGLSAAKSGGLASRRPLPLPKCVPRQQRSLRDIESCTDDGLSIACSLLKSDRLDCRLMGLESLAQLTSDGDIPSQQQRAAKSILKGGGDFRDTLVSLVSCCDSAAPGIMSASPIEVQHNAVMRRCALTVLANCLSAVEREEESPSGEFGADDSLVGALVGDVSRCADRPHEACQAVRVLTALAGTCPAVRARVREALMNGRCNPSDDAVGHHDQLREEAARLRLQL